MTDVYNYCRCFALHISGEYFYFVWHVEKLWRFTELSAFILSFWYIQYIFFSDAHTWNWTEMIYLKTTCIFKLENNVQFHIYRPDSPTTWYLEKLERSVFHPRDSTIRWYGHGFTLSKILFIVPTHRIGLFLVIRINIWITNSPSWFWMLRMSP